MNQEQISPNGQNNYQQFNQWRNFQSNGIKSFKIGGIFSIITLVGFVFLVISFITLFASTLPVKDQNGIYRNNQKPLSPSIGAILLLVLAYIMLAVGGIGAFVCAIIGLVNASSNYHSHPSNGIMIAAGVVGILSVPIASTILFFMAYNASKN